MSGLSPGSTKRRWDPEGGVTQHREKIHKETKFADEHKNLPFTFSKPPRNKKHDIFKCTGCGNIVSVPSNTVMIVCRSCKKACKVESVNG